MEDLARGRRQRARLLCETYLDCRVRRTTSRGQSRCGTDESAVTTSIGVVRSAIPGVETVAAATSTATEGLLALYRSIDTDSLDEVIAPGRRGSARSTVTVEFEYPRRRRDSTGGPSKFAAVGERRVRPDRDTD